MMLRASVLCSLALSLVLLVGSAKADIPIYQATTFGNGEGINFGPDGTASPPTANGYWEMGNTITFTGAANYLTTVDVGLYGGGDVNYPIQMDIYSGSDPNTGPLLGTSTAPAGFGSNFTTFNFGELLVPNTVTFILSLPDQNGSYDSIFLYPLLTSGAGPTIGSGTNSLWYSTGSTPAFTANNTYAIADGNLTNFVQAQFNATVPEPSAVYLSITMLAGLVGFVGIFKKQFA
jgi:hypothetical protein